MNFVRVWKSWLLLSCVLRFDIGLADTEKDGFSGEVKTLFEDLTEYKTQVQIAKEKINEFKNETWDRKYAIALINLYTQPGQFYLTLNAEMKHNYSANTDIWKRAGDLTNKAVDILQSIMFPQVYRGCQSFDDLPILGKEYYFKHITTASLSKYTVVSFVKCEDNFLFQIENVYGVSVEKYSHYPQDNEVIIKSTHTFYVFDGPHKEGQYNVYFLSGQARESVSDENNNDAIHAMDEYALFIIYVLFIFPFFLIILCVYRTVRRSRSKMYKNLQKNETL